MAAIPVGGEAPLAHRAVAIAFVLALAANALAGSRSSRAARAAAAVAGLALLAALATYLAHGPVGGWERVVLAALLGWVELEALATLRLAR